MKQKHTFIQYIQLLLILCFTISFTGCQNSDSKKSDNKSNTTVKQNTESSSKSSKNVSNDDIKSSKHYDSKQSDSEEHKNKEDKTTNNNINTNATVPKKTIVIDPGHGKGGNKEMEKQSPDSNIMKIKDPGGAEGVVTKTPEYEVNFKVALKLKSLLEKNNFNVIMTRDSNEYSPGNIERAEIGNKNNASLEIRIHCDSADNSKASGASMLVPANIGYAKDISNISKQYGQTILNSLIAEAGMKNRGIVERSDLTGFNWSKVPVVLIEMGFMSNPDEDKLLSNDEYQNKLASGLCNGIIKSLS